MIQVHGENEKIEGQLHIKHTTKCPSKCDGVVQSANQLPQLQLTKS